MKDIKEDSCSDVRKGTVAACSLAGASGGCS